MGIERPRIGTRLERPLGQRTLRGDAGVALFVVLWVLFLLMVVVGHFSFTVRQELKSLRNFKEATQAYYIAEAGLNLTLLGLAGEQTSQRQSQAEEEEEMESALRVNAPIPAVDFADGRFTIWIENASGKINLNTADTPLLRMMLDRLVPDEDQKNTIVDSIMDWRDADELHRLNGAESDYYRSLTEPYSSKNADFDTVDELLYVKGVTPELFYGGLREMATVFQDPAAGGKRLRTLFRKRSAVGTNRININAAPETVLLALPDMTEDLVEAVRTFRSDQDFKSLNEVSDVVGADVFSAISSYLSLELSPYYTIYSEGVVNNSSVRQRIALRVRIDPMLPDRFEVLQRIEG